MFQTLKAHPVRSLIGIVVIVGLMLVIRGRIVSSKSNAITYQTGTVERGTLIVSIDASGQVSAVNNASVTTQSSGVINKLFVQNGQKVNAGDKIASLDLDLNAKQQYSQALSSFQSAKNNLANAQASLYSLQSKMFAANQKFMNDAVSRNLATGDPVYIQESADWLASEQSYKTQQNAIIQAQTAVNTASLNLQNTSSFIVAPISGTIQGLSLQVGSVLTGQTNSSGNPTSQKVASVITDAAPNVSINITEIDAPKIVIGDRATITFDAFPDKTFTGKVVSIDSTGLTSSGVTTYPTVIKLDTVNPDLYANMSASAHIIVDTRDDVLLVPSGAVQTQNGQSVVRVMENGKPQYVSVTVGKSSDTQTEITSGLTEGQTVVTGTSGGTTTTSTGTTSPFSRTFGGGGGANLRIGGAVRGG